MKIIQTRLEEVVEIQPMLINDDRGFFIETYSKKTYSKLGIKGEFVQDNLSHSSYGVLRGLHYQLKNPQGKLVRVVKGKVFDVAVDIRFGSPSFGKATWCYLEEDKQNQLWIPPGFAHGFCVLSDNTDFEYKCTDFYYPDDQYEILWNDKKLQIPWPLNKPVLSKKDANALPLDVIDKKRLPVY